MRALVTGANGAIGPSLVNLLVKKGWDVHALVYQSNCTLFDSPSVKTFAGDITAPESMKEAFQGVDVVFHLAALLHILNPAKDVGSAYHLTNVVGTKNVITCSQQESIKRLVFFSTIAVYGDHPSSVITEDTEPQPTTDYGKTKLEAEDAVLAEFTEEASPLGVVLRLGAVYGPRIKGNYEKLLHSLANGRFIPIGQGQNRRTLVYDRDVAAAAFLVAEHPAAPGRIFNVTDGKFHTVKEIIAALCKALDREPPRLSLPLGPVRHLAGLTEDVLRLFKLNAPITRKTIEKYAEEIMVDGCRIQEQLGFRAKYDLAAGWNETVAEMRNAGDL